MQTFGPRMQIAIAVPDALAASMTITEAPVPQPVTGFALLDTGASNTSIDEATATALGLPVVDTIQMATPSTTQTHNVYPARLAFPGTHLPPIAFIRVAGVSLANQGIIALLGRDFLAGKVLHYDGATFSVMLSW